MLLMLGGRIRQAPAGPSHPPSATRTLGCDSYHSLHKQGPALRLTPWPHTDTTALPVPWWAGSKH